jgi:oligopeptidase B
LLTVGFAWGTEPGMPKEIPFTQQIGQYSWTDTYHWMTTIPGETPAPALIDYINEENAYSRNWLKDHDKLRAVLLAEFKKNEPKSFYSDLGIQVQGHYEYRISKNNNIIRINPLTKKSTVFFSAKKFFADAGTEEKIINNFRISPDHKYAVVFADEDDQTGYYLYDSTADSIRKIPTADEPDEFACEWTSDSSGFLFAMNSRTTTLSELFFQGVGSKKGPVSLIRLTDVRDEIELSVSTDQKYLFVAVLSYAHRDVYTLPADAPFSPLVPLIEAKHLRFTFADHDENGFIIQTNLGPDYYDLYTKKSPMLDAPLTKMVKGSIAADIETFDVYKDFYITIRKNAAGLQDLEIYNKSFKFMKRFSFDDGYYYLTVQGHRGLSTGHDKAVIIKNSVLVPEEVLSFDLLGGLKASTTIKGNSNFTKNYIAKRIEFKSYDGTLVPLTLIYKKGLDLSVPHKVHYSAYGCYGSLYDLNYAHGHAVYNAVSLMDRGLIVAIAHVRGGGDKGLHWFLEGRYQNRMNTLNDFIAGAEFMIEKGITRKRAIGISSYSAGGFIIGNVITKRPDLWGAAINYMGFTDYIGTMLNDEINGTSKEWNLVGDPRDPETFKWMLPMSPQDNLRPTDYPPVYTWSARDDSEVLFHEGVKFTAKLRKTRTNQETTLLTVIPEGKGDHGGSTKEYLNDVAQSMTFILEHLKLN